MPTSRIQALLTLQAFLLTAPKRLRKARLPVPSNPGSLQRLPFSTPLFHCPFMKFIMDEVKYVPRNRNSERSEHQWCPQGASLSGRVSINKTGGTF
ncbi:hypothetical protein Swol_1517 [Syntrophomonas wolfei subsp. wolfei str. Goettingen G311]|uniref:Uncharacterized protein n=1 Tax=Syntrophomonas wolfei subsp. wolfei (strain DSM 2245B / Goettingen) TaxID=335541 RepID=Q0AWT4_SYNWW|nr:hypothetical protein Swol_1517 [Syntrophomonas wolfei subsp. wolfei str. Goettingen G311]